MKSGSDPRGAMGESGGGGTPPAGLRGGNPPLEGSRCSDNLVRGCPFSGANGFSPSECLREADPVGV